MGKTREREKRKRHRRLAALAERDTEEFANAWALRVESWMALARERAKGFQRDAEGRPLSAFSVVELVLAELEACVPKAASQEEAATREIMIQECVREVARVADRKMLRLNNYEALARLAKGAQADR